MAGSYPSQNSQDSEFAIRGYLMAIEGRSFQAIQNVLRNVIAGRQAGFDAKFAPTSGELGIWTADADNAIAQSLARSAEPKMVSYRSGEKPPKGYVSLSEYEDKKSAYEAQRLIRGDE